MEGSQEDEKQGGRRDNEDPTALDGANDDDQNKKYTSRLDQDFEEIL